MGTVTNLCVNSKNVNNGEMILDNSVNDPATSDDYKKKTKTDEDLKVLVVDRLRTKSSQKTYTKGKVKILVF